MRFRVMLLVSLLPVVIPAGRLLCQQQHPAPMTSADERAALHTGPEWQQIEPHLPDPRSATAAKLEVAGDVLRARRFPEDALDYYGYAMARGGNVSMLLNKMGVVRLELQQNELAREMFLRVVRAHKKDAQAWNNLGVTEYVARNYAAAIADYSRAAKLNKHSAVFRSNLGMAYLEAKDVESARTAFAVAIKLKPEVMQTHDGGGASLHVLGTDKFSDLCFEMARLYARSGALDSMRLWIARASEGGLDVRARMADDPTLHPFLKDPAVQMILANAAQLRSRSVATAKAPGLSRDTGSLPPPNFD